MGKIRACIITRVIDIIKIVIMIMVIKISTASAIINLSAPLYLIRHISNDTHCFNYRYRSPPPKLTL